MKKALTKAASAIKKPAAVLGIALVTAAPLGAFAQSTGGTDPSAAIQAGMDAAVNSGKSTIAYSATGLCGLAAAGVAVGIGIKYIKRGRGAA